MKLPNTLSDFILWLIDRPYITSDSWKTGANVYLLAALCVFEPGKHKSKNINDNRWDKSYHNHCPMVIGATVETGGVSGGSCWDDSNPSDYRTSNMLPDLSDLVIKIVGEFHPDITLVQYTNHFKNMILNAEHREHEYYGNCTEYASVYIPVETLYNALKSLES